MEYTKILEAISSGVNKSLIDFDDSYLQKTLPKQQDFKKFNFGDYVLYDKKIGYNNYIGKPVAICVNDTPGNSLYVVLNHENTIEPHYWANYRSRLFNTDIPVFDTGYETTKYIFDNYTHPELYGTIWGNLDSEKGNIIEYIPTIDELRLIHKNCKGTPIYDIIFKMTSCDRMYWSCDSSHGNINSAEYYNEDHYYHTFSAKNNAKVALVLLHI